MSEDRATVTIEVDGREIQAKAGDMLINVTDAAGIPIPRFCYHKKLSVAANCRMCLVEVENVPKPLPACATPVNDGMKVYTRSPKAIAAQKGTMEFLLINHPLDCPICDQGGECELQDVAMGYGGDVSRFVEAKRVVPNPDLGPLVSTDMTRCIHCTRCVRFGAEIAGIRELGATGRGEHMRIGTYVEHALNSELSGNIIDVCPVGALTSKPFRFRARAWELTQFDGIAPHDAVGANIHLHVQNGKVMRVVPKENEAINETWISDRDRFSYEGLYSSDRLMQPMLKDNGAWREVEWEEALEAAVNGLRAAMGSDSAQFGTLIAPTSTVEELYLAQKLTRGLGSGNIDHRLRQTDFRSLGDHPPFPWLNGAIADLEDVDAALVIGSHTRKEQPLLAHRLRKAALKGAYVALLNPFEVPLSHDAEQIAVSPASMVAELAAIAKAAGVKATGDLKKRIDGAKPDDRHKAIAQRLRDAGHGRILLGNLAAAHPDYVLLQALASELAQTVGAGLGYLPVAANSVGAAIAGAEAGRLPGWKRTDAAALDAGAMLEKGLRTYLIAGIDPELDCANPAGAVATLAGAECVVALTAYRTPTLEQVADVMLPMALFAETSGTYVNGEGTWQGARGVVAPVGKARPAWKILRVLGNLLGLEGFDYESADAVRSELEAECEGFEPAAGEIELGDAALMLQNDGLVRAGDVPIYAADTLVRRAGALQHTPDATTGFVSLNPTEAARAGLADAREVRVTQGENSVTLPLEIDPAVPDGCVRIPAGVPGSAGLGVPFGAVGLEKG